MDEQAIKSVFAKKLVFYRKSAGMTQSELAEKLNYSDKSVSKWERAESLPDVVVLAHLAEILGVTVNDLISSVAPARPVNVRLNRMLITLIALFIPCLVAAIVFAILMVAGVEGSWLWLSFIYAIPVSAIVGIVFTSMWWGKVALACSVSALLWSIMLCFVLTFSIVKTSAFLLAAGVFQIMIILFFMIKFKKPKV